MNLKDIFENIDKHETSETIKISYYIIKYCKDKNIEITNLKLNKLLYFINIEYMLANDGSPIFNEEFLAWRHGPVLQSVYTQFCLGIILPTNDKIESIINDNKIDIINKVLKQKANLSAWELVNLTHIKNGPWEKVYNANKDVNGICKTIIPHTVIYNFYKELRNEI